MDRRALVAVFSLACLWLAAGGCQPKPEVAPPGPPVIPVSRPVQRTVTDYVDFTGRTNAIQSVDIRPRVSGYLVQMPFKEGAEVKTGDLLFEVDPRPYKAQLDQAEGQVNLYQAQLVLAKANYARDQNVAKTPGAVSLQQLDQDKAAVAEADAAVKAFQASVEVFKLNLSFTKVTAPVDGQVSRYYLTLGNLVVQDQTLLTTVVSVDPMYVYFDVDEPTVLRIRRAINEGQLSAYQRGEISDFRGAAKRRRLSAPGDYRLCQQPGESEHRQHLGAGCGGQPEAAQGRALAVAGNVRAGPAADQQSPLGAAGDRSRRGLGSGAEVRLRDRRPAQGPISPRGDRRFARGRTTRD